MRSMKLQPEKRIASYDVLAAILCAVMFGCFLFGTRFGFRVPDESFYLAVAQRFAKGDRPLVDEWQLSQFAELMLVPLYRLFTKLTGDTAGIILFMRQVFLLVDCACYWWFYRKLRDYRLGAVIAVAVFCGYVPSAVFALNYYTMSLRLLLAFCLVLMFHPGERPSKGRLLLAGVLLSAAVLAEPPLAVLYVLYSAAVLVFELVRKRRPTFGQAYIFFFNRRNWMYLSVAVGVCAAVFAVYLGVRSGWKNIFAALPELLTDSEYDFSAAGNVRGFLLSKLSMVGNVFGRVNLLLSALLCAVTVWLSTIKKTKKGKRAIFLLSLLLLISCYAFPLLTQLFENPKGLGGTFHVFYYVVVPLPLYSFGLVNYLLCERKDRRLFLLWLIGLLASLSMDSFSDITFGNGAIFGVFPGVICFGEIVRDYAVCQKGAAEKKAECPKSNTPLPERQGKAFAAVCMAGFTLFLVWAGAHVYFESAALFAENILSGRQGVSMTMEKVENGPYKGIFTIAPLHDAYNELLEDLDTIKEKSDGPVYMDPPNGIAFLYLDRPSANCCSWDSKSPRDRQVRYFATHPEKLPGALYWVAEDSLCLWSYPPEQVELLQELSDRLCKGEEIQGNRGRIVLPKSWNDLSDPALARWLKAHNTRF